MSRRRTTAPIPEPLESYTQQFDGLFTRVSQRDGFRQYLVGLLLASERNKTLTSLVNAEPIVGAQAVRVQKLQWYLSESSWDPAQINQQRLALLQGTVNLKAHEQGVLVIDETGDRKAGHKTAHVGRQYLANLGKIDNGVVSVSSLWSDERVYYPLEVEPYTPASWFEHGKTNPAFRTKLQLGVSLVERALTQQIPFRAVVADSFYGEDRGFRHGLEKLGVGYVLALYTNHRRGH
jgi:SRSO17 transposase